MLFVIILYSPCLSSVASLLETCQVLYVTLPVVIQVYDWQLSILCLVRL